MHFNIMPTNVSQEGNSAGGLWFRSIYGLVSVPAESQKAALRRDGAVFLAFSDLPPAIDSNKGCTNGNS
jgi:hypothetical protein